MLLSVRYLSRQTGQRNVARQLNRVALQRRFFKYDGRPPEPSTTDGICLEFPVLTLAMDGPRTALVFGSVVASLFALNWYQSQVRKRLEEEEQNSLFKVSSLPSLSINRRPNYLLQYPLYNRHLQIDSQYL